MVQPVSLILFPFYLMVNAAADKAASEKINYTIAALQAVTNVRIRSA